MRRRIPHIEDSISLPLPKCLKLTFVRQLKLCPTYYEIVSLSPVDLPLEILRLEVCPALNHTDFSGSDIGET